MSSRASAIREGLRYLKGIGKITVAPKLKAGMSLPTLNSYWKKGRIVVQAAWLFSFNIK